MVKVLVCPAAKVVGEKALAISIPVTLIVSLMGEAFVPPSSVVISPAGIVFVWLVGGSLGVARTVAVTVHVPGEAREPLGIVAPVKLMVVGERETFPEAQVVEPVPET
jgi:hypothetical protein